MSAALPEAVLGNLVVAALLAALAAAAGRWGRRPAVTHALWLLVLVKLVTPPVVTVPVRCLPARDDAPPPPRVSQPVSPVVPTYPEVPEVPAAVPAAGPTAEPIPTPVPRDPEPFAALAPTGDEFAAAGLAAFPWEAAALALWAAGSVAWLTLASIRVRRFTRYLQYSHPAPDGLAREVVAVSRRIGLRRGPRVRVVPGAVSPLVWSVGRPTLYFPAALIDRLTPEKRAALIAHELAHLRRGDHWVRWLELAAVALYWWCPLVWVARRELRQAEEECCDAWVTLALPDAGPDYATALLDTIDFLADARVPAMATGIGEAASLRARLVGILADPRPARLSAPFKAGVLAVAAGILPLGPTLARLAAAPRADVVEVVEAERVVPAPPPAPVARGEPVLFADAPERPAGVSGPANAAAVSPDGKHLAVASGNTVSVRDRATGAVLFTLAGHADLVAAVAYSPDGRTIATGSYDGTVRLWAAAGGGKAGVLRGHRNWVTAVAFSPDGTALASGGYDKTVHLWDVAAERSTHELLGPASGIRCVGFSPDGGLVVAAGVEPGIRVWDAATGRPRHVLAGHTGTVRGLAFGPGGKLASASDDHTVRFWDAAAGKAVGTPVPTSDPATAVRFSPGGRVLLAGTAAGRVLNIDPTAYRLRGPLGGTVSPVGGQVRTAAHPDAVTAVLFAPGGPAYSVSQDGTVFAWPAAPAPAVPAFVYHGHTAPVTAVAVAANGRTLAAGARDGSIRVWDATTGATVWTLAGHRSAVASLAFSPDGTRLVSAAQDETVRVWDVTTGKTVKMLTQPMPLVQVALAPDGKTAAFACAGLAAFTVYDLDTGKLVKKLPAPGPVTAVAFSPDGSALATGTADGKLSLWDTARWEERHRTKVRDEAGRIDRVAFARDGKSAAVLVNDDGADREPTHAVVFCNPADGSVREDRPPLLHAAPVADAAFSPGGAEVVTAGHDGRVYVWDAAAGAPVRMLLGHADAAAAVAVSPDGAANYTAGETAVHKWPMRPAPTPASTP